METDGIRKLAFLVGVGQYQSSGVTDLPGPPNDVQHLFDVLTGPGGFGFPKENVCVLTNEEATTTRFKEVFERALVQRARAGDAALKYKKDWERWDRTTMQRVACWRYKQFVTDAASPGGRPGMAALNEPCEARSCQ